MRKLYLKKLYAYTLWVLACNQINDTQQAYEFRKITPLLWADNTEPTIKAMVQYRASVLINYMFTEQNIVSTQWNFITAYGDEYFEDIEELEYTFDMIANSYPDARAFIDAILADDDI